MTTPNSAPHVRVVEGRTHTRVAVNQVAAGTTVLIAANTTKKHKLIGGMLTMSAPGTLKFTDGAGDLSGPSDLAEKGGFVLPTCSIPYLETTTINSALNLITTVGAARGFVILLTE